MGVRAVFCLVLLVAMSSLGGFPGANAGADEVKQAQALYEEGMKNYNVGEYRRALDSFKAGYYAKADPAFLFNMAQCFRMLGDAEPAIREYRAYLRARADAPNREAVERFIDDLEQELKRKSANKPPLGTVAPAAVQTSGSAPPAPIAVTSAPVKENPAPAPAPVAAPAPEPVVVTAMPPPPEAAPAATPVYKKGWFWGVMVGALVVVGAGVGLAVAETTPANASPTGDFAPVAVRFY